MKAAAIALALVAASAAGAHDFWLQASAWQLAAPGKVDLQTLVGTATEREPWRLRNERIVTFGVLSPDGWHDVQASAVAGTPGKAALTLARPGSHLIAFATTPSESELPATEFNAYLEHEGLGAIAEWRAKTGKTGERGRELYARRAKAIVQVGSATTGNATAILGQSLEIVAEANPHGLVAGAPFPVRVFFRGRPLPGARIECESLSGLAAPTVRTTDAEGRARFTVPREGAWKISSIWSVPIEGNTRADFDTLFASLTFGFSAIRKP